MLDRFLRRLPERRLPSPVPSDFVAIDFETANEARASACAVGVAVIRGCEVVASGSSLINSETSFSPYNKMIHGLDEADVAAAPTFPELWPDLSRLLSGQLVVAHHAPFDVSVLRATAARYSLPGPEFAIYCSRRLAKATWPKAESYSLGWLAPAVGIEFDHHVAGEDAIACGLLATAISRHHGVAALKELSSHLGFLPGRISSTSYEPFRIAATPKTLTGRQGNPDADPDHPFYDRTICFTGTLTSMPRRDAADYVTATGGHFRNSVSKRLDYLVIGDADFAAFADGWVTGKLQAARELSNAGHEIEIIPEKDFLELLLGT